MGFWRRTAAVKESEPELKVEEILAPLPQPFRSQLLSMYAGEPQRGSDAQMYPIDTTTRIWPAQGMWLYHFCRKVKPTQTLEIGLAYGFSTLYFLAAIHENGSGRHTSIDPLSGPYAVAVGPTQAQNVGMGHAFRFIQERSYPALTALGRSRECFEVIFVDGGHRFDDALVDFTLSAELCPVGGHIIMDDMWMASIQRAVAFIRTNRVDFKEVETPIVNIAVFERTTKDTRPWDQYVKF